MNQFAIQLLSAGVIVSGLVNLAVISGGCATRTTPKARLPSTSRVTRLELPLAGAKGAPRDVRVLVDDPALKLASIVLRAGTVLPAHQAEVPVTIFAVHGVGSVLVDGERLQLDTTHAVFLAPNVSHQVEPSPGEELVIIVHHLRHLGGARQ